MSFVATALVLAVASASTPPTNPGPGVQPPAGSTMQQQFDDATAAGQQGDCKRAVAIFERLATDRRVRPGSIPAAAIAVRMGNCLVELDRIDDGERAIQSGLRKMEGSGEEFVSDVYGAHMALGEIASRRFDYALARTHFETALKLVEGPNRLKALAHLVRITSFDGNSTPLDYANEGIRIVDAEPNPDKDLRGAFMTLHARVLLNQGQVKPGYDELKRALKLMGGLTTRNVTTSQASMRADLALAALLNGDREGALEYLVYTGAGRIAESPFASAQSMDLPVCGSESGLRPDDVAVVEFAIGADGSVKSAITTYTKGGPEVAAAFASGVRQWTWDPNDLSKIPDFYLASTRVELRCTRAGSKAPGVAAPLGARFAAWASPYVPTVPGLGTPAQQRAALRQILADPAQTAKPGVFVAATGLLNRLELRSGGEALSSIEEALRRAKAEGLPPEVVNAIDIFRVLTVDYWSKPNFAYQRDMRARAVSLLTMAEQPAIASDAVAVGTLRLVAVTGGSWDKDAIEQTKQLALVADDSRLAPTHPLRQAANLQLSNLAATAKDMDGARRYFERTGLTEEQCALIGLGPALQRDNVSSDDFPSEALVRGFEGWVSVEFDISADGKTAANRPVISYPPFVFSPGASSMSRNFVYQSSFRPGGSPACSANRETVRFLIPKS